MKDEKHNEMDHLFAGLNGQWDTEEPAIGHHHRFMQKLEGNDGKKKKGIFWIAVPAAAMIAMIVGLAFIFTNRPTDAEMAYNSMSPKNREAQEYFNTVIKKELAQVEKEKSPETKKLVADALAQMDKLDKDYDNLLTELEQKGENKKIIHAMITNLQTRISFLEEVLTQIENIKKLKETYHENNL
ncbi:hypothetical protein ACLI1A_06835 [Flavobacterium sp. RHBU_3]|uniref:hypothetical protein n=1 Tax=Flavobacterium sp. RHBU_3 TaxID=3391184 RepID=UPI003984791C